MSYANPLDTRIVQVVLDDLEDNNAHAMCDLLAYSYGLPWSVPQEVAREAYELAKNYLIDYRLNGARSAIVPCPKHEGAFDCTPFCEVCEGNQEVTVTA
jgi:hypothetical protein